MLFPYYLYKVQIHKPLSKVVFMLSYVNVSEITGEFIFLLNAKLPKSSYEYIKS